MAYTGFQTFSLSTQYPAKNQSNLQILQVAFLFAQREV
nr:MAG TPA: hypothetical protein [Caudoviricetes sp.]